jgi:hypothetical protein
MNLFHNTIYVSYVHYTVVCTATTIYVEAEFINAQFC